MGSNSTRQAAVLAALAMLAGSAHAHSLEGLGPAFLGVMVGAVLGLVVAIFLPVRSTTVKLLLFVPVILLMAAACGVLGLLNAPGETGRRDLSIARLLVIAALLSSPVWGGLFRSRTQEQSHASVAMWDFARATAAVLLLLMCYRAYPLVLRFVGTVQFASPISPISLAFLVAGAAAVVGLWQHQRWGWYLALLVVLLPFVMPLVLARPAAYSIPGWWITVAPNLIVAVLLLLPPTRKVCGIARVRR